MAKQRLFDKPLTAAQRQQRRRERVKTAMADRPDELKLRQDFYRWLEGYLLTRPELRQDMYMVEHAIATVMKAVGIADYLQYEGNPDEAKEWMRCAIDHPDKYDSDFLGYARKAGDPIPHSSLFFDDWYGKTDAEK